MEKIKELVGDLMRDTIKFKSLHKELIFTFLLRLKQNVEFNSTLDFKALYKDICDVYGNSNPYYANTIFTNDPIKPEEMGPNDVFVFGSNTEGNHAGGAARVAVMHYGAVMGQPRGLQGRSYGFVTVDFTEKEEVNLETMSIELDNLIIFALDNKDKTFYLTKVGTGISGYELKDIASLFANRIIPKNLILPYEFVFPNRYETFFYSAFAAKYYKVKSEEELIVITQNKDTYIVSKKDVRNELPNDVISIDEETFMAIAQSTIKKIFQ